MKTFLVRCAAAAAICLLFWGLGLASTGPRIELDASRAAPRAVEDLTERSIVRDYGRAWDGIARALEHNQADLTRGLLIGAAEDSLQRAVAQQARTGVRTRYQDQQHRLEVVFYAPEGDVMELHDTMECDFQVLDGEKVLHHERTVLRYVVLMTPGADRWTVRQLQSVSQF